MYFALREYLTVILIPCQSNNSARLGYPQAKNQMAAIQNNIIPGCGLYFANVSSEVRMTLIGYIEKVKECKLKIIQHMLRSRRKN